MLESIEEQKKVEKKLSKKFSSLDSTFGNPFF